MLPYTAAECSFVQSDTEGFGWPGIFVSSRRAHRVAGACTGCQGDRRGEWGVSVSGNWRITFEEVDGYIDRLNLEDYH